MSHKPPRRDEVLGVEVTPIIPSELHQIVQDAVTATGRIVIAHHNLHSVYVFHHDDRMRALYRLATWIYLDGMPLVWAGRLLGLQFRREHRMTSVDLLPPLLNRATQQHWRIFYLGSTARTARDGVEALRARWPNLRIEAADGFFDPVGPANEERIRSINQFAPHLLLVGMGMPRQERWVLDNWERLNANVVWTVGACLDYFAGTIPTPPRWMGRVGLEWAFRLGSEPRRLWRRYLLEPLYVLALVPRDWIRRVRRLPAR